MGGTRTHTILYAIGILLFAAPWTYAQVVITEIMYDPHHSSDAGNEWVEIKNSGNTDVSFVDIRFIEAGSKHLLRPVTEQSSLEAGDIAVIVQDADLFLQEFPDYDGLVVRSVFSLRQKDGVGEQLEIYNNKTKKTDFSFTYTPDSRADGTGASLHIVNDEQVVAPATPGVFAVNPITVTIPERKKEERAEGSEEASKIEKEIKELLETEVGVPVGPIPQISETVAREIGGTPSIQSQLVSRSAPPQKSTEAQTPQTPEQHQQVQGNQVINFNVSQNLFFVLVWIAAALTIIATEIAVLLAYLYYRRSRYE